MNAHRICSETTGLGRREVRGIAYRRLPHYRVKLLYDWRMADFDQECMHVESWP